MEKPPVPPPGVPELTWPGLVSMAREEWSSNPLCPRIWERIRPWALSLAACQLVSAMPLLAIQQLMGPAGAGALRGSILLTVLAGLGACLFSLLLFLVQVIAPIKYADWAYRATFVNDPMLRLAGLTKRNRFLGVLLPALVAIGFYETAKVLVQVLVLASSVGMMKTMPPGAPNVFGSGFSVALALLTAVTTVLAYAALYGALFSTVSLRRMIQISSTPPPPAAAGTIFIAIPYLYMLGIGMGYAFVRSVPMMVAVMGSVIPVIISGVASKSAAPPTLQFNDAALSVGYLLTAAIDVAVFLLVPTIMRWMWKTDIAVGREHLFRTIDME